MDTETLNITEENMNRAISAMYELWKLGIANCDMMDELKARIIERYKTLKLPDYLTKQYPNPLTFK